MSSGLARSVQTRLVRHAKALGVDPNLVFARYATERLLYRLSRSPHADRFILKGALLLIVWLGESIRPTRDATQSRLPSPLPGTESIHAGLSMTTKRRPACTSGTPAARTGSSGKRRGRDSNPRYNFWVV